MTKARDQLISDWRQQLAKAQTTVPASPRLAWLNRTQVRLFRFLLANYSHQPWRPLPGDRTASAEPDQRLSRGTFDLADTAELEGKPAKSEGKIRSVLDAVAGAQDGPHAPGPLVSGLAPESWVIVAAASSKLKTGRCCELLRAAGLHARTAYRGDDHMVEVPACERREAFAIIDRNRSRVHQPPGTPRTQPVPLWCRLAAMAIVSMWFTGLAAWMLLAIIWAPNLPDPASLFRLFQHSEYYPIWGSLYVALLLLFSLGVVRRNRPIAAARRTAKR